MSSAARWYIESDHFRVLLGEDAVRVIDGGSRGETFAPFDDLRAPLAIASFEPDPEGDTTSAVTVEKALWRESGAVEIHLGVGRANSSVYPPNEDLLRLFPDWVGVEGRKTEKVERLPATSIDDAVREGVCGPPDFIKLDIHSSEYEALEGADRALRTATGLLVETWHSPVHSGQRLHGDVEQLLNRSGFHLFDHCTAAAWRHTLDGETTPSDRPRLMASDSLFFKIDGGERSERDALVAIALLDLYSYTDYAVRLAREWSSSGVLSEVLHRDAEAELLSLRGARTRMHRPAAPTRPSLRSRIGAGLMGLRTGSHGQTPTEPQYHPLETGIQRLSRRPWR